MLRINQIKLNADHTAEELEKSILTLLHLKKENLLSYRIVRKSIDARKKPTLFLNYVIDIEVSASLEKTLQKRFKQQLSKSVPVVYSMPKHGEEILSSPPVIIGCGPAGLFCAYLLAMEGYSPILIERGAPVEERLEDVKTFWETGVLNPDSNVQFGEGGAGTFSDGKLNTLVKDKFGRNTFVLKTFVKFGAPEQILYEQKPHIGTDILAELVKRMRQEILRLGGAVRFHTELTGISVNEKGELDAVELNHAEWLNTKVCILALGHSARDTFQMLYDSGIHMTAKAFAVGVRIEHLQKTIQLAQYGEKFADILPAASYKLTENLENGRGVYTFCMCPGGYVVNASSEPGRLAVNGMSYHDRAGKNANSAVIVTVSPEDFGSEHPLAGIAFQRALEEAAYQAGGGKIPVQRFEDFCLRKVTKTPGSIAPEMKGQWKFANVRSIFPEEISSSLEEGIRRMGKKIKGYADADALLSGVESRTSSPIRIVRDNDTMQSNIQGIYPCGEGAGYAGGITSAAMDGLKTAEAIISRFACYSREKV